MPQNEVIFFNGEFISAQDLADEQQSQFSQRWSLASGLMTGGIVSGLEPVLNGDKTQVIVPPGQAIDHMGRLIQLQQIQTLDVPTPPSAKTPDILTVRYAQVALPSTTPGAVNRFTATATVQWVHRLSETDVELTRLDGPSSGELDLTQRQFSTARLGSVQLSPHGSGAPVAVSGWGAGQSQGLEIDADEISLSPMTGSSQSRAELKIGDYIGIGTMSPQAVLDVVSATSMTKGGGTVSSDGTLLYFSDPTAQDQLAPDFTIMVQNASGLQMTGTVVQPFQGGWQIDTVFDVSEVDYWYQRPLAMRLGNAQNPHALSIDRSGNLGIGTKLPAAKLDIKAGLTLAQDSSAFLLGGSLSIETGGEEHIDLVVGATRDQSQIALTGPGGVSFYVDPASASAVPALQVAASGQVGIGLQTPSYMLDIKGYLQSVAGGFVFPDGTIQTSAQESVPIGTIIDWWQGTTKLSIPGNFRICDGSVITNAGTYMDGKTTPDLKDMFIIGTTDIAKTNRPEEAKSSHDHSFSVPAHHHSFPHGHASVSGTTNKADSDEGMWGTPDNNAASGHTHSFTMDFSAWPNDQLSDINSDYNTTGHTSTTDTTPPYYSLLKLVRVS